MNQLRTALCSVPLLLVAGGGDGVRFAVSEGTTLQKTFEINSRVTFQDMKVRMNGEEVPAADTATMNAKQQRSFEVTDEYLRLGSGRPEALRRTYDKLTGTVMQGLAQPSRLSSDLEGNTILFTWDAGGKQYQARFASGSGDQALLAGLDEDLDLRSFLPGKDVSEGDSWKIPATAFKEVFTLGGDVGLEDASDDWFEQGLTELLVGKIDVKYASLNEGAAKLRIDGDLRFNGEITDQRTLQPMKVNGDVKMDGWVLWDVQAGHFRSFELDVAMNMAMAMEQGSGQGRIEVDMDLDLTANLRGSAERVR